MELLLCSSTKEPINQSLVGVVDPALVQAIVANRIDQHALEVGRELAPCEALAHDQDAALGAGQNIDDVDQLALRAPRYLAQGRERSRTPDMVASQRIGAVVM